ncbi:hypothetical protein ACSFB8_12430 [Enterococcus faecalis]
MLIGIKGTHYFVKSLEQSTISFPISKEAAIKAANGIETIIGNDYQTMKLGDIIKDFAPMYFKNGTQFLQAYTAWCVQNKK